MKLNNIINEEFTQKDWDEHIGHVVDIILDMAKEDADGDEEEMVNNIERYTEDAKESIRDEFAKRARAGKL